MKSRATKRFRACYKALAPDVQAAADRAYDLWRRNPNHPSLGFKKLAGGGARFSVRIGLHFRALGYREDDTVIWVWIGSHSDYDKLVG